MTDDEIAKLRALCEAATPGPWHEPSLYSGLRYLHRNHDPYGEDCPDDHELPRGNDAAFVVAAREALPKALKEIERLHRCVAGLETEVQHGVERYNKTHIELCKEQSIAIAQELDNERLRKELAEARAIIQDLWSTTNA